MKMHKKFGLIGKDISYSFSQGYFTDKFKKEKIENVSYQNFDLPEIFEFPFLVYHKEEEFGGFNVTIPYKESIIKYLSDIDDEAKEIGAVNTIKITEDNQLIGYNTDIYGFENSLKPQLKDHHKKALILGTGGASKAIAFVLKKLEIAFVFVSRNPSNVNELSYQEVTKEIMESHTLIINCSPVGTYPNIQDCPSIPYEHLSDKHYLFDLIYNPSQTKFLTNGKNVGASIKNGHEMLELQAEKSWEIWNK
ncbi:MAG: shikimate dehydrogenase [Bacteroidetes bacterium MedPE-SWsnd-G1]|nr:MAG: shikimate dehydrogenase [Bacteroidetes bacterium MedPE-SWsnd-G1]